ncbi:MAG: murein biosynthesis integral membrane protein MurJ, partial [Mailhella sp.]|nr:murein biosynthesis integral membrane protein MurJ [Mailhella sp.]
MGAAAVIMAFSVLVSRFMGLLRDKIISWQFGAGGESDIYFAAFVVPDFLNYLLAGGYVSITLIPLLSRRFAEDENDAWRLFGTVFCWATLAIGVLSAGAWLAAERLAPLVAPGFDVQQCARLAHFLRIVLPAQVFFLPGACLSALLYIRRQFAVPALMPLIYNGGILLLGVGLPWLGLAHGMEGFCWGVLAGAFAGAFLLPFMAARRGGLR